MPLQVGENITYKRVWFNGTTSQVTGTDVDCPASFTLGVRFKTDRRKDAYQSLINKEDTGTVALTNYHMRIEPTNVLLGRFGTGAAVIDITGTTIVTDGKWHYAVVVHDSTAQLLKLYLDGFQDKVPTATGGVAPNVNASLVRLGYFPATTYHFNGYMADAFIYNRALTEAEINYCYLHPNNPIRRGLQVSYVQDSIDIPAGTWVDRSGNARNGTLTNTVTSTYNRISAGRNCLFFPTAARSDRVDCGNGATLQITGTYSGEFWFRTVKNFTTGVVIAQKWAGGNGWEFNWISNVLHLWQNDGNAIVSVSLPEIGDGAWKHVVFTNTPGAATGEVYINGVNKTSSRVAKPLTDSGGTLKVGNDGGLTNSAVGSYMCAARIYNRILTAAEVAYNYQHPNLPVRRGLVLNLSPESLYGTQWVDLSGNANHGTITGAVVKNLAATVAGR